MQPQCTTCGSCNTIDIQAKIQGGVKAYICVTVISLCTVMPGVSLSPHCSEDTTAPCLKEITLINTLCEHYV